MPLPLLALRAAVKVSQRLVGKKISRLTTRGVNIAGSKYDPRRNSKLIDKYNRRQLESYKSQLDSFRDRSTKFYKGAEGVPIPGKEWSAYKRAENRVARLAKRDYERLHRLGEVPGAGGMRITDRNKMFSPDRFKAQGQASVRAYDFIRRTPDNIPSVKALRKLTRSLEKKLDPKYLARKINKDRASFMKMLKEYGDPNLLQLAKKLSNKQFSALWSYGEFAEKVSLGYEEMKMQAAGTEDRASASIANDARSEVGELINWARSFPK